MANRARRGLLITAGAVVVGAANQVVTNYAPPLAPGWLRDPWHVWSVLVVLVLILVILDLITERSREEPGTIVAPVALSPPVRFAVPPSSLRPPHVEPGALRGRDSELTRLTGLVAQRPAHRVDGLVVVAGPGGIGKTSLVAVAAAEAVRAGWVVFWMRWRARDTAESLTARMVEAATTLGLPAERVGAAQQAGASLVDLVWTHLEATPGWVVVLDNLDQPTTTSGDGEPVADYRGWIRPSQAGLVVVSSRDQDPATWGPTAQVIRLGPLDEHSGAQVLLSAAPQAGTMAEAQGLSARLGGLPLALRPPAGHWPNPQQHCVPSAPTSRRWPAGLLVRCLIFPPRLMPATQR